MKKLYFILTACFLFLALHWGIGKDKGRSLKAYQVVLPEFVADYFDPMPPLPAGIMTAEGVSLGRKLFYDNRLSKDNTLNCGSCHKQAFAFADNIKFSIGIDNKVGIINSMPIFNVAWASHFFWDGRAASLEEQMKDPITNPREMGSNWSDVLVKLNADSMYRRVFYLVFGSSDIDSSLVIRSISQFIRTLVSFNTRFDQYYFEGRADALTPQEERGLDMFFGIGGCNHCHSDVLLTDNYFRNNGLDAQPAPGLYQTTGKETDRGRVKVPSLRNVGLTAPYMHDGRFATLEEVLEFYSSGIQQKSPNIDEHMLPLGKGLRLTKEQKEDLIAFLHTLTDSSFIHNPAFSNPWY